MKMPRYLLIVAFCAVSVRSAAAQCEPPTAPGVDQIISAQVTVQIHSSSDIESFLGLFRAYRPEYAGTFVSGAVEAHRLYRLQLPPGVNDCEVEDDLELFEDEEPQVLVWGEVNFPGETAEGKTGSIYVSRPASAAARYHSQYAMTLLGMEAAHLLSTGQGVVVAVLDTGVDATHPELRGRVLSRGFNFINNTADTRDIGDGLDNDGDDQIDEMVGHGTFIAGLIALTAPDARILPVVALNSDGVGDAFEVAAAVYYAIEQGADVINMSLGSTHEMEGVEEAMEVAVAAGVVVIAAAGNFNRSEYQEYPASFEEENGVISVAATDDIDEKAGFSNYNEDVAICAPGTSALFPTSQEYDPNRSIYSTAPDGRFGIWEGTSMSTAFVSGAAALIRAQHPEWARDDTTPEAIRNAIQHDLDPIQPGLYPEELGDGRIDIAKVVELGPAQPPAGDLNFDRAVDLTDLGILLSDFGCAGPRCAGDIDRDGVTSLADLGVLLSNFGT